jgi:hypothetical protein
MGVSKKNIINMLRQNVEEGRKRTKNEADLLVIKGAIKEGIRGVHNEILEVDLDIVAENDSANSVIIYLNEFDYGKDMGPSATVDGVVKTIKESFNISRVFVVPYEFQTDRFKQPILDLKSIPSKFNVYNGSFDRKEIDYDTLSYFYGKIFGDRVKRPQKLIGSYVPFSNKSEPFIGYYFNSDNADISHFEQYDISEVIDKVREAFCPKVALPLQFCHGSGKEIVYINGIIQQKTDIFSRLINKKKSTGEITLVDNGVVKKMIKEESVKINKDKRSCTYRC